MTIEHKALAVIVDARAGLDLHTAADAAVELADAIEAGQPRPSSEDQWLAAILCTPWNLRALATSWRTVEANVE